MTKNHTKKQAISIFGAGRIGTTIAHLLAGSSSYEVYLADIAPDQCYAHNIALNSVRPNYELLELNVKHNDAMTQFLKEKNIQGIISCLPYTHTLTLAKHAKTHQIHYFDLTEDVDAANAIKTLARDSSHAFVSQCGLAPGLINILATDLMRAFDELDTVKLRCGALPQHTSNALRYALTWSTDGLINEYSNPCEAIVNGSSSTRSPLADLESIQIDGRHYEAFNTSGGIGSMIETYENQVNALNYKTIRYPGHCKKMRFLLEGLRLNKNKNTLKKILENAIPSTEEDVAIVYISISGKINHEFIKKTTVKKFYPETIDKMSCSAIQSSTARSACAVIDTVLAHPNQYHGRIKQEDFKLSDMMNNRFGKGLKLK